MSVRKPRVLSIEDDPEIIELIRLILEPRGYEVMGRTSGEDGLASARSFRPHLILLDLMMSGMDGWDVYRRLKQDPDLAAVPVVVVTAKAQSIDKMLGLRIAKVDDYITKPFAPDELVRRVEGVLERRESRDMR